jgi:hypothetical protein
MPEIKEVLKKKEKKSNDTYMAKDISQYPKLEQFLQQNKFLKRIVM